MSHKIDHETNEKILRAAKHEFSNRGFQGARMAEIARSAKVNKALIHYYFKSKENLYFEVIKRAFWGREDFDIPVYKGSWDLSPSQKLYVFVYFMVNVHLQATDPDVTRILFWELAEGKKNFIKIVSEYHMPKQKLLLKILEEGIAKGEFETKNPDLSIMNLYSFMPVYSINREIYKNTPIYSDIIKTVDEGEVLDFVLNLVFKSLTPTGEIFTHPDLPDDLIGYLNELMELIIEKKDEGMTGSVFKVISEILK